MAYRATMDAIVANLRQFGQAAPDDEFDGITYWTEEQLQQIADRNSKLGFIKLKRVDLDYKAYRLVAPPTVMFENNIVLYDSSDVVNASEVAYNADTNEFIFTTAQDDEDYMAYGRVVQLYDALAELWQTKADQRFNYIDWKAQNNKMNMAQEYQHCVDRAVYYRGKRIRSFDKKGRGKWFF